MNAERTPVATYEDLVAEIHRRLEGRQQPLIVALDGRSGVGKSTLAADLATRFDTAVISGDDFWSGGSDDEWMSLSPADRADRGIDWRRIRAETLLPLRAGRPAVWHPFDFAAGSGLAARAETRDPAPVVAIDGAYSARPEQRDMIDLAVLVELSDDALRRRRLVAREGIAFMTAWHGLWDEAEDHYFGFVCPRESFDLIVVTDGGSV